MSRTISCLGCGRHWTIPGNITSTSVPCPNCKRPLPTGNAPMPPPPAPNAAAAYPSQAMPPPPPPPPGNAAPQQASSMMPSFSAVNVRSRMRSATLRTFRESNSPLDLLDWKFEKYLTPWIVRFTWLAVLTLAALWITLLTVSTVASLLPETDSSSRAIDYSFRSPQEAMPGHDWLWFMVYRVIGFGTAIAITIIWLLWVRVLLEFAIVVFNMAKSLASIDEKVPAPETPA